MGPRPIPSPTDYNKLLFPVSALVSASDHFSLWEVISTLSHHPLLGVGQPDFWDCRLLGKNLCICTTLTADRVFFYHFVHTTLPQSTQHCVKVRFVYRKESQTSGWRISRAKSGHRQMAKDILQSFEKYFIREILFLASNAKQTREAEDLQIQLTEWQRRKSWVQGVDFKAEWGLGPSLVHKWLWMKCSG